MTDAILTLNAGSSSIKFAVFEVAAEQDLRLTLKGQIEGIGTAPHMIARDPAGAVLMEKRWQGAADQSHEAFLGGLLDWIDAHLGEDQLVAVGHRVVHGGLEFAAPVILDQAILAALDLLCPLAPLHQPHNLAAIRAVSKVRPALPQIACFDTAFHRTQDAVATRIALNRELEAAGVRRYGFHGLSYEFVMGRLGELAPALAPGRVIMAHLGNGASLCGAGGGRSVDTTMSFTALDGLVMGSRCGSIDPGVLLYLLQQQGMSAPSLEHLLYSQSGLLGVSGESADMRSLLASPSVAARQAIDLFVYRAIREISALVGVLGGLDGLVFTAGIGENAPPIRSRICAGLDWLGVRLSETANQAGRGSISVAGGAPAVWVIPTDEEAMIARHAVDLVTPTARQ